MLCVCFMLFVMIIFFFLYLCILWNIYNQMLTYIITILLYNHYTTILYYYHTIKKYTYYTNYSILLHYYIIYYTLEFFKHLENTPKEKLNFKHKWSFHSNSLDRNGHWKRTSREIQVLSSPLSPRDIRV